MRVNKFSIKFLGKKVTVYRVLNASGHVLQVCETQESAEQWIVSQGETK